MKAQRAILTSFVIAMMMAAAISLRDAPPLEGPISNAHEANTPVTSHAAVEEVTSGKGVSNAALRADDATNFTRQMASLFQPFGVVIPPSSINFIESHPYWFPSTGTDTSYQSNVSTEDSITKSMILQIKASKFVDPALLEGQGRILEIDTIAGDATGKELHILLDDGAYVTLLCRDLRANLARSTVINFVALPLGTLTFVDNSVPGGAVATLLMDEVTLEPIR